MTPKEELQLALSRLASIGHHLEQDMNVATGYLTRTEAKLIVDAISTIGNFVLSQVE